MRVAVVQTSWAWAASPLEFFARMDAPLERAARAGAEMAVLPAGVGDLLAGIPVPSDAAVSREALARAGGFDSWTACVRQIAPVTSAFYVHTFESLARRHQLLIVAGTLHLPGPDLPGGSAPVFNAAFVFGPDGEVLGEQRQMRPLPGDASGLAYGDAVHALATPLARVGILIGADFLERELVAELLAQSAQLIIHLEAGPTGMGGRSPQASVWPAGEVNSKLGEGSGPHVGVDWPTDSPGRALVTDLRLDDGSRAMLLDVTLS